MKDDRPYIRTPSPAPPPPDTQSISCGVHSARWVRRGRVPRQLRDARAALETLLRAKGGAR